MFAKLFVVLLSLGLIGASLLALRQARLQVASEVAQARLRIQASDERLYDLRATIASRITPQQVQVLAQHVGPLQPATNDIPAAVAQLFAPPPQAKPAPRTAPRDGTQRPSRPRPAPARVASRE